MPESNGYYTHQCKQCGEDCDGTFCSDACTEEWDEGKAEYEHEHHQDAVIDEQWGPL